jgi:hypothetical protein
VASNPSESPKCEVDPKLDIKKFAQLSEHFEVRDGQFLHYQGLPLLAHSYPLHIHKASKCDFAGAKIK